MEEYHEAADIQLPNPLLHAAIHATVETQVAMGDELPVRRTLTRLIDEGLDRHEAIHAIGSVLAERFLAIMKETGEKGEDLNPVYFAALDRLSAMRWRKGDR